jgi:hypothetical protein
MRSGSEALVPEGADRAQRSRARAEVRGEQQARRDRSGRDEARAEPAEHEGREQHRSELRKDGRPERRAGGHAGPPVPGEQRGQRERHEEGLRMAGAGDLEDRQWMPGVQDNPSGRHSHAREEHQQQGHSGDLDGHERELYLGGPLARHPVDRVERDLVGRRVAGGGVRPVDLGEDPVVAQLEQAGRSGGMGIGIDPGRLDAPVPHEAVGVVGERRHVGDDQQPARERDGQHDYHVASPGSPPQQRRRRGADREHHPAQGQIADAVDHEVRGLVDGVGQRDQRRSEPGDGKRATLRT